MPRVTIPEPVKVSADDLAPALAAVEVASGHIGRGIWLSVRTPFVNPSCSDAE
jgi:hypothetical protein